MTFNEVQVLLLSTARSPEDVFPDVNTPADLKKAVKKLSAIVHPDAKAGTPTDAEIAFKRLTVWSERAEGKMRDGTWGNGAPFPEFQFRTQLAQYDVFGLDRREALFDSISVTANGKPALLHVARKERYESLVTAAAHSLTRMDGRGVPTLLEVVEVSGRRGYVTSVAPRGLVPMADLMAANPDGMRVADVLRMALNILSIIHSAQHHRIAHGSINPASWLAHANGSSCLVDWHYSTVVGKPTPYFNATYEGYLPWEVRERKPVDRGTDMAAMFLVVRDAVGVRETPRELDSLISEHLREGRARPADPVHCYNALKRIEASL